MYFSVCYIFHNENVLNIELDCPAGPSNYNPEISENLVLIALISLAES